ncbi:molybdopterin molybdotransferase MoeA [Dethiobacter alkaliphilus]|uniref:molybdopterin molybdotransferase MoeA n=1 Tax=Dethiobacter alkaliphilus TaxID=427926 RepID=UPI002227C18A|nr:gephyrin-like molybdotransferase Glp [Dethiobacter alkaliphilus]MCW3490063.1 molybdopterin molybdotransferase MoeA [Dethiobacter alkaliphilus]
MLTVLSVKDAKERILSAVTAQTHCTTVPLPDATERVLARLVAAHHDLPTFPRSTMDGYAVRAKDTFGASESMPALFDVVGEVMMGQAPPAAVAAGQALRIATGGMLPEGSDAVVMVEHTEELGGATLAVNRAVAPGENTIARGEDIKAGETILPAGHILRPQDIGALAAMGQVMIDVAKKPRVAILSTGDELVMPDMEPKAGQIRDINSYLLSAWAQCCGAEPSRLGIIPDTAEELLNALQNTGDYDCVILSGGSSAGTRDHTASCIDQLGKPGVLFHGVSMRPGKPLIFGVVDGKPYFGLSGNPTSAMVGFLLFVRPLLLQMAGAVERNPVITARAERNLSSASGREDYIRAALYEQEGQLWARPILGQANLISTVVRGDALLRIPQNSEGIEAGDTVEVMLI